MLTAPIPWWLVEIISFAGLTFLVLVKARKFDAINVHVGYPLLTYFHLIRKWVKKPVVVTEHWSAYHFNFGVKRKLPRVQKIFKCDLPLITVSASLLQDIERFSGQSFSQFCTIPNAINTDIFHYYETSCNEEVFFTVSQWKWPKRPDLMLHAFARFVGLEDHRNAQLRIAGYGAKQQEIEELIQRLSLEKNVVMLGMLTSEMVAVEMNKCTAFLLATEYETFSVVCAEAISSGTPVIASAVGAIPEFINRKNGVMVDHNTVDDWFSALKDFCKKKYDRRWISRDSAKKFSFETVGHRYFEFLRVACDTYK